MSNKVKVCGTGCALADNVYPDIQFNSSSFLKFKSKTTGDGGLFPGKLVFTEELETFSGIPYAQILSEITNNRQPAAFNIGGPGLVSMIHVSQLLGNEDFNVRFFGIRGKDDTSGRLYEMARKTPLDVSNYRSLSTRRTPFTDVLSDPSYNRKLGERTFINHLGAALDYTPDHLTDDFFNADIVCFGGTALVPGIHDSLGSLLDKAKRHQCMTIVNTVYDFRNEKKDPAAPWPLGGRNHKLTDIDLLIMDAEEAVRISGKNDIPSSVNYFSGSGVSSLIITNGADEAIAYSNGQIFKEKGILTIPVSGRIIADFQNQTETMGDTTGCGDNFAGGAIASLAWQMRIYRPGEFSFHETLAWAMASGGYACYYLGGTYFEKKSFEKYTGVKEIKDRYYKHLTDSV